MHRTTHASLTTWACRSVLSFFFLHLKTTIGNTATMNVLLTWVKLNGDNIDISYGSSRVVFPKSVRCYMAFKLRSYQYRIPKSKKSYTGITTVQTILKNVFFLSMWLSSVSSLYHLMGSLTSFALSTHPKPSLMLWISIKWIKWNNTTFLLRQTHSLAQN